MEIKRKGKCSTISTLVMKRRNFIKKSVVLGTAGSVTGLNLLSGCSEGSGSEITPSEDLMREHGVLRRVMYIYDHCRELLISRKDFNLSLISDAAGIIRGFVEDYHEMLEEEVLFPEFTKRNQMVQLVQALSIQHKVGRGLTDEILRLANAGSLEDEVSREALIRCLDEFNHMYRPHAAIEDTAIFAAVRNLISESAYREMGENFEIKETELLGIDGFETMTSRVSDIEMILGINELSQYVQSALPSGRSIDG